MSVEGIAKEVNKFAGWCWNKFPAGLPRKEYERVSLLLFQKSRKMTNSVNLLLHLPDDEIVIAVTLKLGQLQQFVSV